ncbi:hypothetical protein [Blastopirellula marina]|uniref:Uncharacterized protein n=1 Tax=Blastopirellula marina TaxID=124 RepID=A0A2S8G208_9BACT|nr:hypothetical protein [Blastopirellula marina]PQO38340.1 hypothetical protein C5Y98_09750 [Blastopirellula marina]PTL44996.1 hypothetical protein C5Y97_09755 [Blastopirellula marina]
MSLYEYWSEQYDPQSAGDVDLNTEHVAQTNSMVIFFKLVVSTLMTAGMFWLPYHYLPLQGWHSVAASCGIVLLYVGVAFFLIPRPDRNNLGWMGGLMNDPFHYSDNWNRTLRFWRGILGPGRFVAGTILDTAVLLGIAKSDPIPCSYEYFAERYQPQEGVSTANVKMSELPSAEVHGNASQLSREAEYEKRYGLTSARFLMNDDE